MSITVNGTSGLVFGDGSTQGTAGLTGFRNKIMNGDMRIDQRNAGAAITQVDAAITDTYCVDRWMFAVSTSSGGTGSRTIQRVPDVPAGQGFQYAIKYTLNTALSSSRNTVLMQRIEGYNFFDMAGSTVAITFWAKGSKAGNITVRPLSGTAAVVITTAWAKYTVYATASAAALVDFTNGLGEQLQFTLDGFTTAGDTVTITGVQAEKSSVATAFEFRPYGAEVSLCQRYYQTSNGDKKPTFTAGGWSGTPYTGGGFVQALGTCSFRVPMRAVPTVVLYDESGTAGCSYQPGVANGILSTADGINFGGFESITRTTGTFYPNYGYPVLAGYTALAEL